MHTQENQDPPRAKNANRARRTHVWTHICLAAISLAIAALVFQKSDRHVLAAIFAGAGVIEVVQAFVNPFRSRKVKR